MSDLNMQPETTPETTPEATPAKKKCCGKVRGFFTREAKEGQRVPNWKFGILLVAVLLIIWII